MALTIKKKSETGSKAKKKVKKPSSSKATATSSPIKKVIDRCRELAETIIKTHIIMQKAKDPAKDQAKARKELLDLTSDEYDPTEEILVTCDAGTVKFSEVSKTRKVINLPALHKKLGDDAFYAMCSPSVTKVAEALTPAEQADFIDEKDGARTMSVMPKG